MAPAPPTDTGTNTDDVVCTSFASRGVKEHVARVHLPSGVVDIGAEVSADVVADASSIGVQGATILTCANTVVLIDIASGAVDTSDVACDVVSADASTVWVLAAGKLARYGSFADVTAHSPIAVTSAPSASRLAPTADGLLASAFQTDTVMRVSRETGAQTSALKLQGYAGSIIGLSAVKSDRLAIIPWYTDGGIFVFDAKTGARTASVPRPSTGEILHGLACE